MSIDIFIMKIIIMAFAGIQPKRTTTLIEEYFIYTKSQSTVREMNNETSTLSFSHCHFPS